MATTNERVSVLETKVDGMRDDLGELRKENRQDHAVVMQKLDNLRDLKNYILGACGLAGIIIAWIVAHIDWHSLLSNAIK